MRCLQEHEFRCSRGSLFSLDSPLQNGVERRRLGREAVARAEVAFAALPDDHPDDINRYPLAEDVQCEAIGSLSVIYPDCRARGWSFCLEQNSPFQEAIFAITSMD